jgi:hypothetical protein
VAVVPAGAPDPAADVNKRPHASQLILAPRVLV